MEEATGEGGAGNGMGLTGPERDIQNEESEGSELNGRGSNKKQIKPMTLHPAEQSIGGNGNEGGYGDWDQGRQQHHPRNDDPQGAKPKDRGAVAQAGASFPGTEGRGPPGRGNETQDVEFDNLILQLRRGLKQLRVEGEPINLERMKKIEKELMDHFLGKKEGPELKENEGMPRESGRTRTSEQAGVKTEGTKGNQKGSTKDKEVELYSEMRTERRDIRYGGKPGGKLRQSDAIEGSENEYYSTNEIITGRKRHEMDRDSDYKRERGRNPWRDDAMLESSDEEGYNQRQRRNRRQRVYDEISSDESRSWSRERRFRIKTRRQMERKKESFGESWVSRDGFYIPLDDAIRNSARREEGGLRNLEE